MEHKGLIPGLPDEIALECLVRVPYRCHFALKYVCKSWSSILSDQSFYHHRKLVGTGEDLVCLVQASPGHDPARKPGNTPLVYGLTIYNATDGSWMRLPETPLMPAGIPLFCQCVAVAGKLMLVGGWDPVTLDSVSDVYVYDFVGGGGEWRRAASLSTARSFFACAAAGDTVYVAGGHDNRKNALRSAEAYDVKTDTWRRLPDMAEDRDECQGFATGDNGRLFAVLSGYGTEAQGRFGSSAEVFDPDRAEWTWFDGAWPHPNCSPRSSSCLPPRATRKSEITDLPFPGLWSMETGVGSQKGVREYDFKSKSWKVTGPMPDGVRSSPCVAVLEGFGSFPDRLFLSGSGYSEEGGVKNMVYVMDMRTMQWVRVQTPAEFSGFVFSAYSLAL